MASVVLNVPDISCEHCEKTITRALSPLEGVRQVRVDIARRQVTLDYEASAIDVERVKEILLQEEYPVESVATG
jgi:copper chaperone